MAGVAALVQQEAQHKAPTRVRWHPAHGRLGPDRRPLPNPVSQETRGTVPDTRRETRVGNPREHRADSGRRGDLRLSRVQRVSAIFYLFIFTRSF